MMRDEENIDDAELCVQCASRRRGMKDETKRNKCFDERFMKVLTFLSFYVLSDWTKQQFS